MTSSTWVSRPFTSVSPSSICSGRTTMCGDRPEKNGIATIRPIARKISRTGRKKMKSGGRLGSFSGRCCT